MLERPRALADRSLAPLLLPLPKASPRLLASVAAGRDCGAVRAGCVAFFVIFAGALYPRSPETFPARAAVAFAGTAGIALRFSATDGRASDRLAAAFGRISARFAATLALPPGPLLPFGGGRLAPA